MSDDLEHVLGRHLRAAAKEFQPDVDAESISSAIRHRLIVRRRRRNSGLMASAAVLVSILVVLLASASAGPAGVRVATSATTGGAVSPALPTTGSVATSCAPACQTAPHPPGGYEAGGASPTTTLGRASTGTEVHFSAPSPPRTDSTVPNTSWSSSPTTGPSESVPISISVPSTDPSGTPTTLPTVSVTTTVPATTTTVTTPPPIRILLSDSGQTRQVKVGIVIQLWLQSACPASRWSKIGSTDQAVVAPDGSPAPTAAGLLVAQFVAVGSGTAQLRATASSTVTCATPGASSFVITIQVVNS